MAARKCDDQQVRHTVNRLPLACIPVYSTDRHAICVLYEEMTVDIVPLRHDTTGSYANILYWIVHAHQAAMAAAAAKREAAKTKKAAK